MRKMGTNNNFFGGILKSMLAIEVHKKSMLSSLIL